MDLTKVEKAALVTIYQHPDTEDEWAIEAACAAIGKLHCDLFDAIDVEEEEPQDTHSGKKDFCLSDVLDKFYLDCSTVGCPGHYVRKVAHSGHAYLGCTDYPKCHNTINVDYK